MALLDRPVRPADGPGHMIVCGNDTLAERLAAELASVYRERVTLVVPGEPRASATSSAAAALFARLQSAMRRGGDGETDGPRVLQAPALDEAALVEAGVREAAALALVHDDDETNIHAALAARRLNPRLRLVIRLYNRKLGQHLEQVLDQAAALAVPGLDPHALDTSTTVLSDADTAAPALAATAIAGTSKVVQADGLLLRAVERDPAGSAQAENPGLCTLALLSSTTNDPAGSEGSDASGREAPALLPDDEAVAAAAGRGTVVLETVTHSAPTSPPRLRMGPVAPLGSLFSRRLRWSVAGLALCVLGLGVATRITTGDHPLHAAYVVLLDLFAINDPAHGESTSRQVLQLLSALAGLLLLPVLFAAALEAFGAFRTAAALRRPPRGLSGHVVLLGLGKIGTRVLARLRELDIPVVCVEEDPEARGIPLARRLRIPTVIGDVTQEGVLEAAGVRRAHALLALTSSDTTNLEAALYARSVQPELRVALRLYDDDFAAAVYRTLRAAHPRALTRSRSVSTLAAPAFAGAMMGRQILGAIPVERRVLVFAALEVGGHPQLEGRTVAESFRPGAWRVIALDTADAADRVPDLSATPHPENRNAGLIWDLHPGYVLRREDRVVLAATRQGLAELLGRRPSRTVTEPRRGGS
ncbi:potassium transporter TrkA [Streptomyces sp. NBRC 14336]|uniref:NAD(P)-binding protein n=1 Tax=Streptomyces sp. NBRC 14336 TaxID=3030992 RepID=UPI0024A38874|nr:NAD(P)-binding protein [Streptomyces sp. NBRC 14336]WBO81303.1 NAD-binding protein [Streptomyces sp. SBE_14.2]GLW49604.1 potassium transporter TrkA [Streptomyces sp. NBRC 14336]